MSTYDFALAVKSMGESGSVFNLNGSYVPRASTFGVTPLAGSAHTRTPHARPTNANTIPAPIVFFIATSCRTTVRARRYCWRDYAGNEQRRAKSLTAAHSRKLSLHNMWSGWRELPSR